MASNRISIPQMEVVYKEAFLMTPLYRATKQWLVQNFYLDSAGDPKFETSGEILYHIRRGTTISPAEQELRIWWRAVKKGGNYGNEIYTYHMDLDWNVIQMYDIEIMKDGKKIKAQKGELRIKIRPYLEVTDLHQHPILKYFNHWFKERLIRKNLEEHRKIIYQDAYRLQGMIKKYLEMKTFIPEEEAFHEKFDSI